jgi:hypothetical protein
MSKSGRDVAAAVTLLLGLVLGSLGFFRAASADDPCAKWPSSCAGNPGGDNSNGGNGGGSPDSGGGSAGNTPGQPGGSGNTSGGGGEGATGGSGTGISGAQGSNNTPTPIPTAVPPGLDSSDASSPSGATAGTKTSSGSAVAATDQRLAAWAKRFKTTPDEVMSWFGTFTSDDSIGGEAPAVGVHGDDLVTVSDHDVVKGDPATSLVDPAKRDNGVATADGQRVDIALHSTPSSLGSATTDTAGRFSATVRIPSATPAGKHFIVALAPKPNGGRAAFVYPLTVEDRAAPVPAAVTSPRAAKHFPWLLFEVVLGTVLVVALFVVRVNTATRR